VDETEIVRGDYAAIQVFELPTYKQVAQDINRKNPTYTGKSGGQLPVKRSNLKKLNTYSKISKLTIKQSKRGRIVNTWNYKCTKNWSYKSPSALKYFWKF